MNVISDEYGCDEPGHVSHSCRTILPNMRLAYIGKLSNVPPGRGRRGLNACAEDAIASCNGPKVRREGERGREGM